LSPDILPPIIFSRSSKTLYSYRSAMLPMVAHRSGLCITACWRSSAPGRRVDAVRLAGVISSGALVPVTCPMDGQTEGKGRATPVRTGTSVFAEMAKPTGQCS
jgi:hypothetical protein